MRGGEAVGCRRVWRGWMQAWRQQGAARTHRVGEVSHGFNVEQLLKNEFQLILCALGRPGRGTGVVSGH